MWIRLLIFVFGVISAWSQTRIIPHLTRAGGGFETRIILENPSAVSQSYQFNAFDSAGRSEGIYSGVHLANSISVLSPDQIFGAGNAVSHFTINSDSGVSVAIAYVAAEGQASAAHLRESRIQAETWRLYGGNWDLVFDGFAAVNLGSAPTSVDVVQLDSNGRVLQTESAIASLAVNAKTLFVLGDAFQPVADGYFEIRASQPIAVTSLRGTPPSADVGYLWENAVAQFETSMSPTSSLAFPFWETIDTGQEGFRLTQEGSGMAARFETDNGASSNDNLYATHNGSGNALNATAWGTGRAAYFSQKNSASGSSAVLIESEAQGPALNVVSRGAGSNAARFETSDSTSNFVTVNAENYGNNAAGWFQIFKPSNTQPAIWAGTANKSSGLAAFFDGDVHVNGTLSKSAGSFKIDHPMDPQNKYLSHSFVESPDMMNVYNGNVVLDERGEAWIELPDYFQALNRDFRYQLTPLGAAASLFVAREVHENRFKVAGGSPAMKVSWQVTGIRDDAYARAHPIEVETDKTAAISAAR